MTKYLDADEAAQADESVWEDDAPRSRNVRQEWLWEMNATVNSMYARDDIDVHRYEHFDPVSLFVLEQAEASLGVTIPDPIRSFYRVTDGLELRWSYRDGDDWIRGGEIHMFDFGTVFGQWVDTLWGRAATDDADTIDFTWELRGIEDQKSWDAPWMTVLHTPEDLHIFQLYFHDPDTHTLMLDLDFLDYCEALIDTRGVYGWQFLATQVDFEERPEIREHAKGARRVMDEVFPDVDFSRFRTLEE